MKKLFLFMAGIVSFTAVCQAQLVNVAVLQHQGKISAYYSQEAFQQAYNAAEDGDTIMLSGGEFTFSGKFEKGLTVRGTGTENAYPTIIKSAVSFYSYTTDLKTTLEGIIFRSNTNVYNDSIQNSLGKIDFVKCICSTVNFSIGNNPTVQSGPVTRFTNCSIYKLYSSEKSRPSATFANCYVGPLAVWNSKASNTYFINCIIDWGTDHVYTSSYKYAPFTAQYINFINCIFIASNNYSTVDSKGDLINGGYYVYAIHFSANVVNCLGVNGYYLFHHNSGTNISYCDELDEIFVRYEYSYDEDEDIEYFSDYHLTSSAAAKYLGTDGTQVGMYGGVSPYTMKVSYPVITTLQADSKTDKNGKLNITVGVDEKTEDE